MRVTTSSLPDLTSPPSARQPIHTVYGGAQRFQAETVPKLGKLALQSLSGHAGDLEEFSRVFDLPAAHKQAIYERVLRKLDREPVEDYRIDFEDGYGYRTDEEEDHDAIRTAGETVKAASQNTLPPYFGIRIKPLTRALYQRAARTLDLYLSHLLEAHPLPAGFVVTLPKIVAKSQVEALARLLDQIETQHRLAPLSIPIELMIETPESLFDPDGRVALPDLVAGAQGRCRGAHFGAYDYTAALDITAGHQALDHPACDFARNLMQATLKNRGIMLSDGALNVLPIGPREVVHRAWKIHYDGIQRSLRHGFYQGWDLHPAQLPARYAAVYTFFQQGLAAASERLSNFVQQAGQATRVGHVFDDAATGQGLLNFFLRGIQCGAITAEEASLSGLTIEELSSRSFSKIVEGRRS